MSRRQDRIPICPDDPRNLPQDLYELVYTASPPVLCPHAAEIVSLAARKFLRGNGAALASEREGTMLGLRGGTQQQMSPFGGSMPPWAQWQMYQQWQQQDLV